MCRRQSGYALLLMLFVLLSAGVTGLSRTLHLRSASAPGFTAEQRALQIARQALLSYAALYPWLYGPRGAGPGHLPCPDTDILSVAARPRSSGRDGPNPPCGTDAEATGHLPRHVNLPGHRYVFHVEPLQRLEYLVSSDMINNPVNRIVNDEVIRANPEDLPYLAWIWQPLIENGQRKSPILRVPISRQSLLPGVRQSVAAWLVQQVNRHRVNGCSPVPERDSGYSRTEGLDVLNLIAEVKPGSLADASREIESAQEYCLESPLPGKAADDRLLEGVPLASHWFVRNRWHERIGLRASESCASEPYPNCILVPEEGGLHIDGSDERLYFIWRAVL